MLIKHVFAYLYCCRACLRNVRTRGRPLRLRRARRAGRRVGRRTGRLVGYSNSWDPKRAAAPECMHVGAPCPPTRTLTQCASDAVGSTCATRWRGRHGTGMTSLTMRCRMYSYMYSYMIHTCARFLYSCKKAHYMFRHVWIVAGSLRYGWGDSLSRLAERGMRDRLGPPLG